MSDSNSTVPEQFRQITGFPNYSIAADGTVLSICSSSGNGPLLSWGKARRISHVVASNGYHRVSLCNNGHIVQRSVHVLVLEAFIGPCPEGQECRHLDGDRGNSQLANLAWGTHRENMLDRVSHGTDCRGEKNPNATLTEAAVREIRRRAAQGERHCVLAEEFHILRSSVSNLVRRLSWKHVD